MSYFLKVTTPTPTSPHIHDMNIYHDMTSHTLLTCKSHANYNEEAGKHAGYNNELYMTW